MIAFSKWQYPHVRTKEQEQEAGATELVKEPPPEGANVELRKEFFGAIVETRKKWVDETKDYS